MVYSIYYYYNDIIYAQEAAAAAACFRRDVTRNAVTTLYMVIISIPARIKVSGITGTHDALQQPQRQARVVTTGEEGLPPVTVDRRV